MKQRHRVLAWALAGALVLSGVPVRAAGSTVYVSGNGSGENSGMTEGSPLSSIYKAQDLLPEGGTILVTSTIYIADEREYSLNDGVTLQAADELEGPVFEVAEGGKLKLSNVVLLGNSSTLIANSGVLEMDDSVSLLVKDSGSVGCVYTAEGAATYLDGELVAGDAGAGTEKQGETAETGTKGTEDSEDSETEKASEADVKQSETPETAKTEETAGAQKQPETAGEAETDKGQPETGGETETEKKQPETAGAAETDKKQSETVGAAETDKKQSETVGAAETDKKQSETGETAKTDKKQPETGETAETDKKQPGTAGGAETEKGQPETGGAAKTEGTEPETKQAETVKNEMQETETDAPVREEAVETVKNAIVALDIHSREDVRSLLPVSQAYDGLTEAEKEAIPAEVRQLLDSAKAMAAAYNHTQLGVSVYGNLPWYVQFQVKLTDLSGREENGQKVLVPYELSLWNLYTNAVYTLPEGESVTVTMPVPDVEIEGEFTVIHYKSDGTVESIKPVINGNMMSFETSTFSPFTVAGSTVITGVGIGSGTPSGGNKPSGNDGSSTEAPSGTGSSTGSGGTGTSSGGGTGSSQTGTSSGSSTGSGSQTGSTSGSSTGNYNAVAVNTGDSTNVVPAVVTFLAALLVIVGILLHKKKKNQ